MVDSTAALPKIVSDTNRKKGKGMAEADIASDMKIPAVHQQRSDSTSGTAGKMSDRNVAARGTIDHVWQAGIESLK